MSAMHLIFLLFLGFVTRDALATLPIQHWQTDSGARVLFIESRDLPIVDVSVDFMAGSSTDTRDKSGRAGMTLYLLSLGAGGLGEDEIAKALADVGAQMGAHFDQDRAGVTLRTLSNKRERTQALDILKRVIQHPAFPENVLE